MSAFIDTSALLPLLVHNDPDHADVLRAFEGLLKAGRKLVTSSYVLVETSALLQGRIGLPPVRDLHESLLPVLETIWVTEPLHRRALERLLRADRRRVSLVDCVSFEVMEQHGVREALAIDPDFEDAGFRVIP